jgi:hypothetical protein
MAAMGTRGFSLVECTVAATMCAVGLLALAGSNRALIRLALLGHRTAAAAVVADARIETLRAARCDGAVTGRTLSDGIYLERWSLAGAGTVRAARVDVEWADGSGTHRIAVATAFPCPP